MDTSRLTQGDLIAAGSGLALLVAMFLPWYGVDVNLGGFSASESGNAWEVFSTIDLLLFVVAAVAVGAAIAKAAGALPADVPAGAIVAGAGALAFLLVLYRIVSLPGPDVEQVAGVGVEFGRKFGIFLGLIAAGGVAYGGYASMNEAPQPAPPAPEPPAVPAG